MDETSETPQPADSSQSVPELGSKDVAFLRAINTINSRFDTTAKGVGAPATTGRIREVSGLDENAVQHRLKRSEKVADLIKVHPAPVYDTGQQGPKSAELTEAGKQALDQLTSGDLAISGIATPEDISRLERKIEDLQATVMAFEENPTGALDDREADHLDALKNMMIAFQNAFEELGVDLDKHRPDAE